jgi:hypothetical protein
VKWLHGMESQANDSQLTMSSLLSAYHPPNQLAMGQGVLMEPFVLQAKEDVRRVLEILEQVGSAAPEMQKTRTDVLRCAYEAIRW